MNYKGHLTVGFICFCIVIISLFYIHQPISLKEVSLGLIICLFGSLAPDLDHKQSKIHRWSYAGSILSGSIIYLFTRAMYPALTVTMLLLLTVLLLSRLKHRGITHHAPGFIIFTILLYLTFCVIDITSPIIVTLFGAIGYLSHIVTDYIASL